MCNSFGIYLFSIFISFIILRYLLVLYKGSNTSKHLISIIKGNETNVFMIIKINSYDMWSMGDIDEVSHNICKTNTLLRIFMYKTPSCNCSFSCGSEKNQITEYEYIFLHMLNERICSPLQAINP